MNLCACAILHRMLWKNIFSTETETAMLQRWKDSISLPNRKSRKPLIFCVLCRPTLKSVSVAKTFIWYTDCLPIPSMMKCGFVRTRTLSVRYQIANLSSDIHRYPALYTPKQRLTAAVMRKSALMCRKCVSVANCFLSSTIRSILILIAAVVTISRTDVLPASGWKIWKNFMYKKRGANAPLFLRHKDK